MVGWHATVLERAPVLREIGAGMSQAPNAMRALAELGVGEQARSAGVPTYAAGNPRTPDGRYLQRARPHDAPAILAFPLPTYVNGRVALLGDAAHAMSPDRGRGAGQSIEDAVVPAAALASESTVDAALDRYDADRRPRTQAAARGARKDGHRTTSMAAYRAMVTMIRMMPASPWRTSIAPDVNPTWRWQPPPLPSQPTRS